MTTLEAQLEKAGATCSICGNAFSSNANPATVFKLKKETYKGAPVFGATCSIPPYATKHKDLPKDTTLKVVYQSVDNKLVIMYKSLDKEPVPKCSKCGQPIIPIAKKECGY